MGDRGRNREGETEAEVTEEQGSWSKKVIRLLSRHVLFGARCRESIEETMNGRIQLLNTEQPTTPTLDLVILVEI
jgi:hypothetical protein